MQDTQLQVKVPVALKPVFTISHAVTRDSPLNGKTQADILKDRGFFILIVSVRPLLESATCPCSVLSLSISMTDIRDIRDGRLHQKDWCTSIASAEEFLLS
jgi:hypothetical protein